MLNYRSLFERVLLRLGKGNLYEGSAIRNYYERTYGISVGMYSVHCFDRWRIPPGTTIGRYCSIAGTARLIEANHPIRNLSTHAYLYSPEFGVVDRSPDAVEAQVIEDDVWMGHGSIVTPECRRIGRGAVIGAGSVVMRDVPRYGIMVGSPARLVGFRFSQEVMEAIESTRWWLLDKEDLRRGLEAAPHFRTSPSVEAAQAFLRALGRNPPLACDPVFAKQPPSEKGQIGADLRLQSVLEDQEAETGRIPLGLAEADGRPASPGAR